MCEPRSSAGQQVIYQFGDCELDADIHELQVGGEIQTIEPQVFDLLLYLIENRDRMVTKDELFEHVWKGRIVSETNLSNRIGLARQAVGDDGKAQGLIKTFPRRGFRFIGTVEERDAATLVPSRVSDDLADATSDQSGKPSIAVLPFDNLSGDPEQEYFSDGITEDIITALSRIRQLFVTARNTTFAYKGKAMDVQSVAAELGVRYVLEGSVRKAGNRVRITAQLIDGKAGNQLWAEQYDRELEDIFAVQDEIKFTVVGALQPELTRSEIERARRKPPESLDAWDLYQRGLWHVFRMDKDGLAAGSELFSRAIELNPDFPPPYIGLADCYAYDKVYGNEERDSEAIFAPARKAVELDPQDANARRALGMVHFLHRDHVSAIGELEMAVQLSPTAAHAYMWLGFAQTFSGLANDGLNSFSTAIKLSPRDPIMTQMLGGMAISLLQLKRYEESLDRARQGLQFPNVQWTNRSHFVSISAHSGRIDESRNALSELLTIRPDFTVAFATQRFPFIDNAFRDQYEEGLRIAGTSED